jgi:hypothetical protein
MIDPAVKIETAVNVEACHYIVPKKLKIKVKRTNCYNKYLQLFFFVITLNDSVPEIIILFICSDITSIFQTALYSPGT